MTSVTKNGKAILGTALLKLFEEEEGGGKTGGLIFEKKRKKNSAREVVAKLAALEIKETIES